VIRNIMLLASFAATSLVAGVALQAQAPTRPAPVNGKSLFQAQCAGCHLDRGFGTRVLSRRVPEGQATLEARKDLNADYVSMVVRRGIGSMPQFRKSELSDVELDAISTYLEKGK
jgi:mono/diheme cytochrome c family protein